MEGRDQGEVRREGEGEEGRRGKEGGRKGGEGRRKEEGGEGGREG